MNEENMIASKQKLSLFEMSKFEIYSITQNNMKQKKINDNDLTIPWLTFLHICPQRVFFSNFFSNFVLNNYKFYN